MINEEILARQQYIRNQNSLKKPTNVNDYVTANKKKVELDKKLEELSINSNVLVSGTIIRQNILNSSASTQTTINNVVDTEVYSDIKETSKNNELVSGINRGKQILDSIKNNSQGEIPKIGDNKFNRNI